jgi:hypothetical protein
MNESLKDQLKKLSSKMMIGKRVFPKISESEVKRGTIVYLEMDSSDGLIITGGYDSRFKFITIVGETSDNYIVGSLLINTKNGHVNDYLRNTQYLLSSSNYPTILDYDSWLDCSQLFHIPKSKVLNGGYCGKLAESDMNAVLKTLENSTSISKKDKIRYGIIDK